MIGADSDCGHVTDGAPRRQIAGSIVAAHMNKAMEIRRWGGLWNHRCARCIMWEGTCRVRQWCTIVRGTRGDGFLWCGTSMLAMFAGHIIGMFLKIQSVRFR
jgi:hypothetical protein